MKSESQLFERIPTIVCEDAEEASAEIAQQIVGLIRERAKDGRNVVLGLATGSTPVRLYKRLIAAHRDEGLSFRNVVTFNLDEYYGLEREHPESYWRFMHDQLFDHIDIPAGNIHVPDGRVPRDEVFDHCQGYEEAIEAAGGLDIQILGIGRTGHIGFNEPGSAEDSPTRLVTLDSLTRKDAARDFKGESAVPRNAITMGIGTILKARRIFLMAWGKAKAGVVAKAVEERPTPSLPASFLQVHAHAAFYVDRAAATELTRFNRPWLTGHIAWEPPVIRQAVTWLSRVSESPLLKLRDADYSEHGLSDLLTEQGLAYYLNIRVFNDVQRSITGWPGGKPEADDTYRPSETLMPCHEADMTVPLSPDELQEKVAAIYCYQTQRNQTPGLESPEPWEVARTLCREAAQEIDDLGLAEYEALERFKRWNLT